MFISLLSFISGTLATLVALFIDASDPRKRRRRLGLSAALVLLSLVLGVVQVVRDTREDEASAREIAELRRQLETVPRRIAVGRYKSHDTSRADGVVYIQQSSAKLTASGGQEIEYSIRNFEGADYEAVQFQVGGRTYGASGVAGKFFVAGSVESSEVKVLHPAGLRLDLTLAVYSAAAEN